MFKRLAIIALLATSSLGMSQQICETCIATKPGDIVHRRSSITSLYVGHAGVSTGDGQFYHVTTGYDDAEAALQKVGMVTFFVSKGEIQESYGAKRSMARSGGLLTGEWDKLVQSTKQLMAVGVQYDANHLDQKGKFFDQSPSRPITGDPGFFEFDCVGYVEGIYAHPRRGLTINLTPDDQESGVGWPLTVFEQRDSQFVFNAQ